MPSNRLSLRSVWHRPLARTAGAPAPWLLRAVALAAAPWVEIEDRERLASLPEPAIFVFNHNNTFECCVVPPILMLERGGRPLHLLVDWMVLRQPLIGWLVRQSHPIPVYGKRHRQGRWESHRQRERHRSPVAEALAYLAAGESVGLFPEGRRNRDASFLLPPRAGLAALILASTAPVVPVGISFRAAERTGRVPAFGSLWLSPGAPLDFAEERQLHRDALQSGDALGEPEDLAGERAGGRDPATRRAARRLATHVGATVMRSLAALCDKRPRSLSTSRAGDPPPAFSAIRSRP